MPKGDNLKGPFGDLPHVAGVVAAVKCRTCSVGELIIYKPVKINGHGWPFANCSGESGCGTREATTSMASAKKMISDASNWRAGAKGPAYEIAGLTPKKPEIEAAPEKVALEPEKKPVRKKSNLLFGMKI